MNRRWITSGQAKRLVVEVVAYRHILSNERFDTASEAAKDAQHKYVLSRYYSGKSFERKIRKLRNRITRNKLKIIKFATRGDLNDTQVLDKIENLAHAVERDLRIAAEYRQIQNYHANKLSKAKMFLITGNKEWKND